MGKKCLENLVIYVNVSWIFFLTVLICVSAERSSTGLVEFETKADAIEGLVACNHQSIPNPSKFCFHEVFKIMHM